MRLKTSFFILCFFSAGAFRGDVYASHSDLARVSKEVSSRIDFGVLKAGSGAQRALKELLEKPLTSDSAVRIALLNNQSLQAVLESWGIAKADFNRTRLPENPVFRASVRFPRDDEPYNNTEFTVEQDFLSLILFPLKSDLAGARLQQAELGITNAVLDLVFQVKSAFYEVQGGTAMLSMRQRVLQQAEASGELAKRQFEAGNISELGLANERALVADAKLEFLKAKAELRIKKEDLNRLLGSGGEDVSWEIQEELGSIRASEPSLEELFSVGLSKRVDLLIARKNVQALKHALSLSRFGILGHPELGVSTEKEVDGDRVTGPTVRTEVAIYDLGQTEVSRSRAELKEAELRLKALENDVRSEIRQKREFLLAARTLTEEYKNSVIPIREKITEESQKHQNYMLIGSYELIRAKQNEILAYKEYVDVLKEYWIARSDLEKAVSSNLANFHGGSHE